MTEVPSGPGPRDDSDDEAMPRWVKVSGAIFIVFVLVVIVLHLTGRGFGGH